MKLKSQFFVFESAFGLIYQVFPISSLDMIYTLDLSSTSSLVYVRLSGDSSKYIIKDRCSSRKDLDEFIRRNVPKDRVERFESSLRRYYSFVEAMEKVDPSISMRTNRIFGIGY